MQIVYAILFLKRIYRLRQRHLYTGVIIGNNENEKREARIYAY